MKIVIAMAAGLAMSVSAFGQGEAAKAQPANAPQAAPPDLTKPTLFVVAYAHLDTQWRWAYPQTIREFIANTLHHNFALFEKYPGYVFNFSGSRRYEMMEEYFPAEFEKLRGYVAAGKWFPCGSSVDENDANVPSAESLVRQVLYGNHYFKQKFGVVSQEYMLPDCFGFPAALPQVLAHCGVKGFSTQKLTWNAAVPIPFKVGVWEGPDGSSVIAALDPGAYVGEVKEDLSNSNSWQKRVEANGKLSGVYTDYHYYGTGDQGGAPKEASVDMVEKSVKGSGPLKVLHSKADEMFKAITPEMRAKLPRYKGELELTQHSAGSVTSQAYMKRWNRKNELLADAAERAAVAAAWIGARDYPAKKLESAWYLVLGSQMHDILPGTSLPKAYDFSWNDEVLAANQFSAVLEDSAAGVIGAMDTSGKGSSIVVYNPTSIEREDLVTVRLSDGGEGVPTIVGPDGKAVVSQAFVMNSWVTFVAKAPPVGFAAYKVERVADAKPPASSLRVSERELENEYYVVKVNDNGDVSSIHDKKANRELLSGPVRLGLHYENPSAWPAWNQDWEDRQRPAKAYVGGPATFFVAEEGSARVTLEVTRETEGSTFTQRISLSAGTAGARVEFDNDIVWNSRERSLRVAFPLAVSNPMATYDIQSGVIERPNSHEKQFEYSFHQWFDLTDKKGDYGVTVACDSKYGSDKPNDNTVRLTLLHTPGTRGGYQDQGSQDLGRHSVQFAIVGHAGGWQQAMTPLQASRLNQPLIAFNATSHAGSLGKVFSLARTSDAGVQITAMKKAEDSDEVVIRLRELPGKGSQGVKVAFAKPVAAAREVDGQEQEIGKATVEKGELVTDVRGLSLKAFAVKLGQAPAAATKPAGTPIALAFDTDAVSTNAKRGDGAFAGDRSLPAEQLPRQVVAEGITFNIGPTEDGKQNAVTCKGQEIKIPEGSDRLYLLAAADEDVKSNIGVGGTSKPWSVQAWGGYVGQWDRRMWKGETPESAYSWSNDIAGMEPGFVKPDSVAWYCSHHHTPAGDAFYEYCYLFKYAIDLPAGTTSVKLPNEAKIKVFAATAAKVGPNRAAAAAPLFDTLSDHVQDSAKITMGKGPFTDSTEVRIEPGMYWRSGGFRYTLDGSDPTEKSAVYSGPIRINAPSTLKVMMVDAKGNAGSIASARIDVNDKTPPSLKKVVGVATSSKVMVQFSEPVEAADAGRFTISPGIVIKSAELSADRMSATLMLASALEGKHKYQVMVSDIRDTSPAHNTLKTAMAELNPDGPVYSLDEVKQAGLVVKDVPGLPVKAGDSWTINMFVKTDKQPPNHTVFAGFGTCADAENGMGRYVSKFANGVHFWSANQDVEGRVQLDLNRWQMLSAAYDGKILRLYKDGKKVGERAITLVNDANVVHITPKDPWDSRYQFSGEIKGFTIWNAALSEDSLAALGSGGPK